MQHTNNNKGDNRKRNTQKLVERRKLKWMKYKIEMEKNDTEQSTK